VFLRPLLTSDYEPIRLAEASGLVNELWRNRGLTPSPEAFVQRLWQNVAAQYLVVPRTSPNHPAGIVMAYNASFLDGYAYVGFARFPNTSRNTALLEGAALFVDHLFTIWPLRKLYAEATEASFEQFASGQDRIFEVEARLNRHIYSRGEYVDQLILSCTRERWLQWGRRFAEWASAPS